MVSRDCSLNRERGARSTARRRAATRGSIYKKRSAFGMAIPTHALIQSLSGKAYNTTCPMLVKHGNSSNADGQYSLCNASGLLSRQAGCQVISVGIGSSWGFEDWLATSGCVVHAFDPTIGLSARHRAHAIQAQRAGKQIRFYFAGLAGNPNSSMCKLVGIGEVPCRQVPNYINRSSISRGRRLAVRTTFLNYGMVATDQIFQLKALLDMASMPYSHAPASSALKADSRIAVLKIDCEG